MKVTNDSKTNCNSTVYSSQIIINGQPVANGGAARLTAVEELNLFDGSESRDSDGAIVRYEWEFRDGIKADGVQPIHAFTKDGRYDVLLTVSDDVGLENSSHIDTILVIVNSAPHPVIGIDPNVCAGRSTLMSANMQTVASQTINGILVMAQLVKARLFPTLG